jgi:chromosome segregation ATPase
MDKFKQATAMKYIDQAKFFLNAFWTEYEKEAENVWKYTWKFIELDLDKKKDGCDLDEFNAHRFLEQVGETKRVVELRETLKAIDLDFNKRMALIEYLLFRYKQTIKELVSRPQGSANAEEMAAAQQKVTNAQNALAEMQKAEAEAKLALEELNKQETAYKNQIKTLEDKSKDTSLSMVQRNKAAAELAQVKSEDPLPLRKAKITQEASVRKVEKQTKEAEAKVKEALDFLEEVKKKGGAPQGAIWWMEREVKEAQKYLPKSKQKA